MPLLDLDSLAKVRQAAALKKIETIQGLMPSASEIQKWKDIDIDESHFGHMHLPGLWEGSQLGDMDGVVWFRKTINLTCR